MSRKWMPEIVFLFIISFGLLFARHRENSLANNHQFAKATVVNVVNKRNSGKGFFLEYKLNLGSKSYYSNQKIRCDIKFMDDIAKFIIGKEVSVVYDVSSPRNNKILLTYMDFSQFKRKISENDSLIVSKICLICNCNPAVRSVQQNGESDKMKDNGE